MNTQTTADSLPVASGSRRPAPLAAAPPLATRSLVAFALATVVLHLIISGGYGWFRDELYYIEAGKHLAGGYVEFPIMVAILADLQRAVFGTSLNALHVLPALAGAGVIVLTGLMARELGGGPRAQRIAALAVLVAPGFFGADALFTMDAFDQLWWTAGAFILLRLLGLRRTDLSAGEQDRRRRNLWLLFGVVCGLGLLTKLTILAFGLAVVIGLLLGPARRELRSPWPYVAGAMALLFLVPYVLWNAGHGWATLSFWHNYGHTENTATFIIQVILLAQPLALPLWLAGLWYLLRNPAGKAYRPLGWVFLVLCILFLAGHAKSYFLLPAFPPLLAAGGVALERRTRRVRSRLAPVAYGALVLGGIVLAPVVAPVLPPKTFAALMPSPIQPVADRFGWPQFVGTVATVYHRLPPAQQAETTLLAGNYGEAGALDLLGGRYHLPRVISPHNTYYFWGVGVTPGRVVIATDFQRPELLLYFRSVRQVAIVPSQYGIQNEEVGRPVFLCEGLRIPWSKVWPQLKNFS
ncbi:MAG: ArnT family glycosyltransferase [Chloroflexota bacterium]